MKRIAFMHFYTFRLPRGIETLTLSLSNELAALGYNVTILAAARTIEPLIQPSPAVNVIEVPVPRYYASTFVVPGYVYHLIRQQFDTLIVFFADFGERLALQLAKPFLKDTKLIVYMTYPYPEIAHRYESLKKAGMFQKATHIFADAKHIKDTAEEFVGREVTVLPVGTDPEHFRFDPLKRAEMRSRYGYTDNHIVLLNVSALESTKGPRRVIDALPDIVAKEPNIRYLILGAGEDEAHLQAEVLKNGLEDIVTFAGTTRDLAPYYYGADIFVMLPNNEANSVASHEALASGLPVVASNTGGFVEVMKPAFSRLVPPMSRKDIVEAILELAQDADLRLAMGKSGREHIVNHLTWRHSAERLAAYL